MSYDVWLEVDLGGPEPSRVSDRHMNITSNIGGMYSRAVGRDDFHVSEWEGQPARNVGRQCRLMLVAMRCDPPTFRALNPPNGWGDYDSAMAFLQIVAEECEAAPAATVRTWC